MIVGLSASLFVIVIVMPQLVDPSWAVPNYRVYGQNLIFPSCCKEDNTELLENLLVAQVYLWSVTGNRKLTSLLHLLSEQGPNLSSM